MGFAFFIVKYIGSVGCVGARPFVHFLALNAGDLNIVDDDDRASSFFVSSPTVREMVKVEVEGYLCRLYI